MTRAHLGLLALVIVVGAAVAAPAHADGPEAQPVLALTLPQRIVRHQQLAAAARAAGDLERAAAHHIEACFNAFFAHTDAAAPPCLDAERAAAALTTTHMLARLRYYQSSFAAWGLDWELATALVDEAERLGRGGPPADTLAGAAQRGVYFMRGVIDAERGRYTEVARTLGHFLALAQRAGDVYAVANGETFLCRHHWRTGRLDEALAACARGLIAAETAADPMMTASLLWNRAAIELDRGDAAAAATTLTEAQAITERMVIPVLDGAVRADLAITLIGLGRLDQAERHVASMQAGLDAGRLPPGFGFGVAFMRGDLAAARGDDRAALAHYRITAGSPIAGVAIQALVAEAGARERLGDLAAAEAGYRAAIARIERARATAAGDPAKAGYMQRQVHAYQALVGVLWARHGDAAAAAALTVAESARARALLDALRGAGLDEPVAPRDAAAIQAGLPPDTTLLFYVAGERHLYGFAVTAARITLVPLPGAGTRDELAARVELYRALLATSDDAAALAGPGAALYGDLIAPLIGDAPGGTLLVAADGPLHRLPFDALYRPGRGFLIEAAEVGFIPSGSLLARRATPPPRTLPMLVVVSPPAAPPLPPLPAARAEAAAIGAVIAGPEVVLEGAGATEAALRGPDLARFDVLHFATHAVIDDAVPLRSALLLAPGAGSGDDDDDGWLRAEEIYRLELHPALVVLSACDSGSGRVSAEGPMSLARAFLHAGAGSVIATLWEVEDGRGPALARALYSRLGRGQPVGAALAGAKRALIRDRAPPRAWAAWVAIGDLGMRPAVVAAAAPSGSGGLRWAAWILAGLGVAALGLAAQRSLTARRDARARIGPAPRP